MKPYLTLKSTAGKLAGFAQEDCTPGMMTDGCCGTDIECAFPGSKVLAI